MKTPIRHLAILTLLTAAGLLLAASPAAAIPVCGNGVCESTAFPPEDYLSCPADCGGNPSPCTPESCTSCSRPSSGFDYDYDSVPDRLEYDLAHKFFPAVLMQWADVDRDESYLYKGRATPYTIQRYYSSSALCNDWMECLEIRYGITFFYDHGDVGGVYSHPGDSEMYAALLRRTTAWSSAQSSSSDWQMIRDFTSAHWGAGSSESSEVGVYGDCPNECSSMNNDPTACSSQSSCFAGGYCQGVHGGCYSQTSQSACQGTGGCNWVSVCVEAFDWDCHSSSPLTTYKTVYASESKHALYHTDGECDGGGWYGSDDCPNNQYNLRSYKSGKLQNVGRLYYSSNFDTVIKAPNNCGDYDVWSGAAFGEATSYRQHFTTSLNWALD